MSRYSKSPAFFFARGLLGVFLLLGIAMVITNLVAVLRGDNVSRDVDLHFKHRPRIPGDRRDDDVALSSSGDVGITILDAATSLRLIDALPLLLVGLATVVVAWSLLVVVIDIQRGVPFEAKASRRLRRSAVIVAVAAIGYPVLSSWADAAVREAAGRRGFDLWDAASFAVLNEGVPWLLLAAVLAVFGSAFGTGRKLAEDSEGLV